MSILAAPAPALLWWKEPARGQARNSFAEANRDFCGTLLAMAGHDLRQPLQVITSAHDVLAQILDSDKQREELARAAAATARLGSMLSQLVEALPLRGDRAITSMFG